MEKPDLYKVLYPAFRYALDRKFDISVEGQENIPDGPAMYTPNHIEMVDSPLVAAAYTEITGKPMRFGAKIEYFNGEGVQIRENEKLRFGHSMKWLLEYTRMIPVDRDSKNPRDYATLEKRAGVLFDNGDAVALHPEGTRTDDNVVYKFKRGAAQIALKHMVPIVPVGVVYAEKEAGEKRHVDILFGKPVTAEEYTKLPYKILPGKLKVEHLSRVMQDRVAELTGMEISEEFAELRKNRGSNKADSSE